jgi:hypothetical protein
MPRSLAPAEQKRSGGDSECQDKQLSHFCHTGCSESGQLDMSVNLSARNREVTQSQ